MPGNKCQYFNCFKTTTKCPNLSMFRIPKDERHKTWIINSGNVNLLSLDKTQLYNRYICQEHFSPDSFMNNLNKNLKPTAILYKHNSEQAQPSTSSGNIDIDIDEIDLQLKTLTPTKIYNRTRSDVTELIFPSPYSIYDTPKRTRINDMAYLLLINMPSLCSQMMTPQGKLNKIINEQKNKLRNKTVQISKLKGCLTRFKTRNTLQSLMYSHKFTSKNSRAIVTMQLKK